MARLLVIGGAGFIGSHCVRAFIGAGYECVVYDDLSSGFEGSLRVKGGGKVPLHVGDIRDREKLSNLLAEFQPDVVAHFAAKISAPESLQDPLTYFDVNLGGTLSLLEAMRQNDCSNLLFSSTCAVYGNPQGLKHPFMVKEGTTIAPISPYGESKAMVEKVLDAVGIRSVRLRYFNAAGASNDGWLGDGKPDKQHLIGAVFRAIQGGAPLKVFGEQYPTSDGTGVRDYIHVEDLAEAHLRAVNRLVGGRSGAVWNLGVGRGYSVLEVIRAAQEVTGQEVPYHICQPRAGDPPALVSHTTHFENSFGWCPSKNLISILSDAWRWELNPRYGGKKS